MCLECGCGKPGPTRIDGRPAQEVSPPWPDSPPPEANAPHHHPHTHPDGHSHAHEHAHPHDHDHPHTHDHGHSGSQAAGHAHTHEIVDVNQAILSTNDRLAERNRGYFRALGLLALNMLSSPGSGKTTFIQKTVSLLNGRLRTGVIVGDLETDNDARRIRAAGAPAVQVTTGTYVIWMPAWWLAR
jgi:hydrogenase nickel incorporation protein HypB